MRTRHFKLLGVLAITLLTFGAFQAAAVQAEDPDIHHIWLGGPGTHTDGFTINYPGATPPAEDTLFYRGNFDGTTLSSTRIFAEPEEVLILAPEGRKTTLSPTAQSTYGLPENVWLLPGDPSSESPGQEFEGLEGWSSLVLNLDAVTAPTDGKFVMTNSSGSTVLWDSSAAFPQALPGLTPSHQHYSWYFSAPGLYVLDVTFSGTKPDSTPVTSSGTYFACVTEDGFTDLGSLLLKLRNDTITEPEEDELHDLIHELEEACGDIDLHAVIGDDHGGPGEPGEGNTVELNVTIDEGDCFLTVGVASGSATLSGGDLEGDLLAYTGQLPNVTVTSSCADDWSVNGQATDFTSNGDTFGSNRLGWTPALVSEDLTGHTHVGGPVAPGPEATDGLKVSRVLGESHEGGQGTATFNAALALKVPTTTPPGEYSSTLTLSVFTEDHDD